LLSSFQPDQSSALESYGVLSGQIFGARSFVAGNFLHPGVQFQNPSLRYALASQMDIFTSLQIDPSRFAELLEARYQRTALNYKANLDMLVAMDIDLEEWKSLEGAQRSVCHQEHSGTIAKVDLVQRNWPWLDTLDQDFADGEPNARNLRILKCALTAYSAASLHLAVACCNVEGGILTRSTSTQKPWIQAVLSACNCAHPKPEEIEPMTARYRAVVSEFGPELSSGFLQYLAFCVSDDAADVRRVRVFLAELAPDVRLRFSKVVSGKLLLDCVSTEHGQEKMRVSFNAMGITEENDIALALLCGDKFLHRFIFDDAGRGKLELALRCFKVTLANFGEVLTKTHTLSAEFVERFIVDDAGRGKLELALEHFKVTLAKFGEVLTKSSTLSVEFVRQCVVDDAGRVRLAIGCAHFGLTLNQMGVLLLRSNFKSAFVQKYIMDSSKWCFVKRLDKFSSADVDASLANRQRNAQTPATGRLVELSNMQHPDRPEWSDTHIHTFSTMRVLYVVAVFLLSFMSWILVCFCQKDRRQNFTVYLLTGNCCPRSWTFCVLTGGKPSSLERIKKSRRIFPTPRSSFC